MEYLPKGLCSQKEVALHTHDRIAFKRCRRKWSFSSPFRRHLTPKASRVGVNPHLWFGSGIHFALEDYHGYKRFDNSVAAYRAYVDAFNPEELPDNIDELVELGEGMLEYYEGWEPSKSKWKTVWVDGKPLVEEHFSLVLEDLCSYRDKNTGEPVLKREDGTYYQTDKTFGCDVAVPESDVERVEVVYHGTVDSVVEDEHGDWWILDYKTAKAYDGSKLVTDPQISAYCWAAEQWFERPIMGMVYLQMIKTLPKPPRITSRGVSTDKRQKTTHRLYRETLTEHYGDVQKAPAACIDMLNNLAASESEKGDAFIMYDMVTRNTSTKEQTYKAILGEGREMIDPDLPIYPNPTRDCAWDCPFRTVCIAMDEGADWEYTLETDYELRHETMNDEVPGWMLRLYRRNREQYPEEYDRYCKQQSYESVEDFIEGGNDDEQS